VVVTKSRQTNRKSEKSGLLPTRFGPTLPMNWYKYGHVYDMWISFFCQFGASQFLFCIRKLCVTLDVDNSTKLQPKVEKDFDVPV
jgi:hypothetical protein